KKYDRAEVMLRRELAGGKKILGQHHRNTLLSAHNLGVALRKHHEGEAIYRANISVPLRLPYLFNTLMGAERMLASDNRDTLKFIYNLSGALHKQSESDEAERLHLRALAVREKALGLDHRETVQSTVK
ncbi:hypothetical protein L873DRAFT_1576470, partial [Choiromyces venosus 120613-1]